jgi:hypothetical protein
LGELALLIEQDGHAQRGVGPVGVLLQGFQVGGQSPVPIAALLQGSRQGDLNISDLAVPDLLCGACPHSRLRNPGGRSDLATTHAGQDQDHARNRQAACVPDHDLVALKRSAS